MFSRLVLTLLAALALLLAPVGAAYALGLGSIFSDAELEISLVKQSKDGAVIDVHGTDYSGDEPGIDIALNPSGYRGSGTSNTFIKSVRFNPDDPEDWNYRFTLDAAQVARLDPDTTYQIMTMRGGGRDTLDSSQTRAAEIPFDFDELTRPEESPSPQEPSTGGSSGGSSGGTTGGSGSGDSEGTGGGASSGGSAGDDDGTAGTGKKSDKKKSPKKPWKAPEEPPTAKGLDLTGLDQASVDADGVIHARASGFKPNETDIKVVVYSKPLVLSTNVKANRRGVAKWSGKLPKDIGLGKHTLTFQGSVDRGIRFVVTGTPSDGECVQSGCAPAAGAIKAPAPVENGGIGLLTLIIVAAMIVLALAGGAVALLSGRRKRDREWDEPTYAQTPPRYPSDPRQASGPSPAAPRRQPQSRHEAPLPRRLPADQQPVQRPQGSRQPGPRQPAPRQSGPRQPSHRQPVPQGVDPQPMAPPQPIHRQPRSPESFAPPSQRSQAYEGQRVAGR